jgi:hypothetical protein
MGSFILSYLFISLLIIIAVAPLVAGQPSSRVPVSHMLAIAVGVLILLAFLLVPIDSQPAIHVFQAVNR